ncbi:lysosomal amino acid transporter 1 homolog isoform X2 [Gouania willdenowi]|uniref:Lysosomal amino acid transporter 1 homolog n=1 Tax=Gouania willdenowi TaxID=441366 RepID=A0A8C5NA78_GOUWI|nr:lysosomal amino acid transporter 1 homolog isoform X2 [Gouania willdenowi]
MWKDGVLTRNSLGWTTEGDFNSSCPNGTYWVWEVLKECAQDARDMASVYLGLLSILCFMVSSLPQYYSSCKTGNMDSALSIWFLLLWLGGDSCNLIGSFLADQLPLQKYTAIYYVIADLLMLALYMYYKLRNRAAERQGVLHLGAVLCVLGITTGFVQLPSQGSQQEGMMGGVRGRSLLSVSANNAIKAFTEREIIGFCIGSISSVLYLFSRLPQMYTNFKRKSTEGVSYFLFALVILGNTTYGLSVLLKEPDKDQAEGSYLIHHLPWLIGSLGTLTFDLIISVQFIIYRKSHEQTSETTPLIRG